MQELDFLEQLSRDLRLEEYLPMYILAVAMLGMAIFALYWYFYRHRITQGITPTQWSKAIAPYQQVEGTVFFRVLDPETGREIDFDGGEIIEYQRVPEYRYTAQQLNNGHGLDPEKGAPTMDEDEPTDKLQTEEVMAELRAGMTSAETKPKKDLETLTPWPQTLTVDAATYVCFKRNDLDRQKGEILALEVHGLLPGQDLTSKMRKLKIVKFVPGRSKIQTFIIIILMVYNLILTVGLLQERPPDFITDPVMFGWYFSVGLLFGFQKYLDLTQWGFWGVLRIEETKNYEMSFMSNPDFEITIPVYRVAAHYFPGITLEEAFGVDPLAISRRINNYNKMLLHKAISSIISLKKQLQFYEALIKGLRKQTDEQQRKIDTAKAEGYAEGMEDAGVPPITGGSPLLATNWVTQLNPTLKTLIFIGGIIALAYFGLDLIQSITFGFWEKVWITLGLGAVVLFLLLLVYNYVIRPPVFR